MQPLSQLELQGMESTRAASASGLLNSRGKIGSSLCGSVLGAHDDQEGASWPAFRARDR